MRGCVHLAVACAVVVGAVAPGRAEDKADARAIVERAIKATGGKENLAKLKSGITNLKGTIRQESNSVPLTAEVTYDGATKERVVYQFSVCGDKQTVIHVLNGDKGWNKTDEGVDEMDENELKEVQEQARANWLTTLLPLLDKDIQLTALKERKVDGKPAAGVKASSKGHRDVSLYFDKESGLLAILEMLVNDEVTDQEVTETTYFTDYKEVEGIQQAMKFSIRRDGKPYFDGTVTGIKLVDQLKDSVFAKP
jgi:hypothetical protein